MILSILLFSLPHLAHSSDHKKPIMLEKSGGFHVGGKVLTSPLNPSMTLSCDHGYMEYFIPWKPRRTSLVMWHSAHMQVWQNRWDGGTGFKDLFLSRDYPIFLWDAPWLGRANWGCSPYSYQPSYRDQGNFEAWSFGSRWPEWHEGVQFPTKDKEAWNQATRSRYIEFDTHENMLLQSHTAAVAADSGKLGDSVVILTNSAAGLRAQMTAVLSNTTNIKGIVTYESYGFVYPDNANITEVKGGFGPVVVPLEDFKKLTKVKIQFVWGDYRLPNDTWVAQGQRVVNLINMYGGDASMLFLAEGAGLKGSTHSAMADMDNDKVADQLDNFLGKNKLDQYASWKWF